MKTVLTICAGLLLLTGVDAQKKPNINKAKALWEQGILDEAKTMIDEATTYEKTMNDGKTWYYRGLIYASIDTSSNDAYKSLVTNPLEVAMSSFAKADELGDPDKEYFIYGSGLPVTKSVQISKYYEYYFNKALDAYNNDEFEAASVNFATANKIIPEDTASLTNAGFAAQSYEDYERAKEFFSKAVEKGVKGKGFLTNYLSIIRLSGNNEEALSFVGFMKELYPTDTDIHRQEISLLLEMNKADEAMAQLVEAIKREPNDARLRFAMGILKEEMKDTDGALKYYDEALSLDPNHYESSFNKAAILFNEANALYKEKGLLGYSAADQKKAKELDPKIKSGFTKALPAWEKVYSINPKERSALETLLFLYAYMGEEKKADKIEAELNALGDDEDN